jgi:hypothetical protein
MFYDPKICKDEYGKKGEDTCKLQYDLSKKPYNDGSINYKKNTDVNNSGGIFSGVLNFFNVSDAIATTNANTAATSAQLQSTANIHVNNLKGAQQQAQRPTMIGGSSNDVSKDTKMNDATYKVLFDVLNDCLGVDKGSLQNAEECNHLAFLKKSISSSDNRSLTDIYCVKPDTKKNDEQKIKWPYTYVKEYEDLIKKDKTCKYGENNDTIGCIVKYPLSSYKAWLAATQASSWTTTKWAISNILLMFLPYISSDLEEWLIKCKIASFIDTLKMKINEYNIVLENETNKIDTINKTERNGKIKNLKIEKITAYINETKILINKLQEHSTNFFNILREFNKIVGNNTSNIDNETTNTNIIRFIKEIMQDKITKEAENIGRPEDLKYNNIYTDFLISALKPEEPKIKSTKYKPPSLFRPLNSTGKNHWKRYILTWFMWAVTMGILAISGFLGFWATLFGSFNKYSHIVVTFISIIVVFGLSMYNSMAQPFSILIYSLFGFSDIRKADLLCPNSSGKYQMKKNNIQYYGINMFITLFFIVTRLGFTIVDISKSGSPFEMLGWALTGIFPVASVIIIILKVLDIIKSILRFLFLKK